MTHDAYSTKRVTVWPQKRGDEDGMAIKYQDGYISWCPKAVFERDYQPITAMSFGHAIHALKAGKRVARAGWNGKGMFLFIVNGSGVHAGGFTGWTYTDGKQDNFECAPFIAMKTADDKVVPWLASQTDILATDWSVRG